MKNLKTSKESLKDFRKRAEQMSSDERLLEFNNLQNESNKRNESILKLVKEARTLQNYLQEKQDELIASCIF